MNKTAFPQTPWLHFSHKDTDAPIRLFCFPYAGGNASLFRTWQEFLPAQVCALKLPGREQRIHEPAFSTLTPLVETLAHILQPYLDRPFLFFGHSMGSLISFELARYLRRQNMPEPQQLFVSAHRAPQLPRREKALHQLADADFIEQLRQLNGTPEQVLQHAELMQLLLPLLRADFSLCETYQYREETPLNCPIIAFGGTEDKQVPYPDLNAWSQQTRQEFTLHMFPGNHFFLQTMQSSLLQILGQEITHLGQKLKLFPSF